MVGSGVGSFVRLLGHEKERLAGRCAARPKSNKRGRCQRLATARGMQVGGKLGGILPQQQQACARGATMRLVVLVV